MKRHLLISLLLIGASTLFAQGRPTDFPAYGLRGDYLISTPGTYGGAAGAVWNPAAWAAMPDDEIVFQWDDRNIADKNLENWGLFAGGDGFGASMQRHYFRVADSSNSNRLYRVDDYSVGVGGGPRDYYWGVSYNWARGATAQARRDHHITVGNIWRPCPRLSLGGATSFGLGGGDYRGLFDLGVRPLSTHRLTIFGDASAGDRDTWNSMQYGAGAEVMPVDGLRLALKWTRPTADTDNATLSLSMGVNIDGLGFHAIPHLDNDNKKSYTGYLIRLGNSEPSFDSSPWFEKNRKIVTLPLKGVLTYQKEKVGANYKIPLRPTVALIEQAKQDARVAGIAINLSGFNGGREMIWELREKLADFKRSGKKVYIYMDEAGMSGYYLASVADYLWMDPQGMMTLPGYVAGRTFWKGFFEKIGVGVEEWRYFTYKSAFEAFARRNMSEPDKEQRLALISDFYEQWATDVAAGRGLTRAQLEVVRDSTMGIFVANEAYETGLVDTLGCWDDLKDFVEKQSGSRPDLMRKRELEDHEFVSQRWGEPPHIAVVYAVGECAMDSGIRGRYTSRMLRKLAQDRHVKAVVLRADSPGGESLPSDLVAREMSTIRDAGKPMLVSQGAVAASGGYWISMNGSRIVSSPFCVTGSIGVIAGWLWNQGFSDKTGFTSDHVKVGEHADLDFGVTLPFLGVTLPDRTVTDIERVRVEKLLKSVYAEFTDKVADARVREQTYIDSIGQGRVWSGQRALENGLVDEIGTLETTIAQAKQDAGLKHDAEVQIEEYPKPSWINPALFGAPSAISMIAKTLGFNTQSQAALNADYELAMFRKISSGIGRPLHMLPPEDMPFEDGLKDPQP
jgi:protease-4